MCLHDFDDLAAVGRQIKRVLRPGAALLIALLHPFVTGALVDSYSSEATYESTVATADKAMVYRGRHRPLGAYLEFVEQLGLRVDHLQEVADPRSIPARIKFLHIAASSSPQQT